MADDEPQDYEALIAALNSEIAGAQLRRSDAQAELATLDEEQKALGQHPHYARYRHGGIADVYDFCPRFEHDGRMYRPVAFVRIVRPIAGAPRLRVSLNPATGWGAADAERTSGTNHVRYLLKPQPVRLTTDAPVGHILEGRAFRLEQSHHFFLGPDEPAALKAAAEAREILAGVGATPLTARIDRLVGAPRTAEPGVAEIPTMLQTAR